jgi:hypothetical protein
MDIRMQEEWKVQYVHIALAEKSLSWPVRDIKLCGDTSKKSCFQLIDLFVFAVTFFS